MMTKDRYGTNVWVQAGIENGSWGIYQTFISVSFYEDWIKEKTMGNQPGFVTVNSDGFDPDSDFSCEDYSVFAGGENLVPISHFISLSVPLLFFYLLL